MKKFALILFLSLLYTYIGAADKPNMSVYIDFPRNIKYNSNELFEIRINNIGNIALQNLELSAVSDNYHLEIVMDKASIEKLEPKESIGICMRIVNNNRYYFNKDVYVTLKVSSDEITNSNRYKFTIRPVENFWLFTVILISIVMAVLLTAIFIKLNKGEENVR